MTTNRYRSKGLSLMMVTAVVAVASVMGIAILSSNTLQAEASSNQDQVVQADALAESGVNLVMYYLQNLNDTTKCPATLSNMAINGTSYTQSSVSLGASVPGTFDLQVAHPSANRYTITSTGKSSVSNVTRKLVVTADVNYFAYGMSAPNISSGGSWTIPASTSITGDVYASGSIVNNGSISGSVFSVGTSGSGNCGLIQTLLNVVAATLVPTVANVNHYATYTYNGGLYTAGVLVLSQSNVTLGPTALNPAGVYVAATTLDITGNVKVNGTLVCSTGATLRVQGTGNTITPVAGFPALVVDGNLTFKANNSTLDVNGLVYLGGNVNRSSSPTGCKLNVTGSLLLAGTSVPTLDSAVAITVKYDRTKTAVTTLTTGSTKPGPASVSLVTWKN